MEKYKVLVTGVGGNVGQGIIKSLRAGKHTYHIVGIDMEPLSAGFSLSDSYHIVPRTSSPEFAEKLHEILEMEKPSALYACSPTELIFFSRNKEEIERKYNLSVFVNPVQVVKTGMDKLATSQFLQANGFAYPMSCMANDTDGVKQIVDKFGFPVFVKPREGASSANVFIADSFEKIGVLNDQVPDLVAQQYLPGDDKEYTSAVISDRDGKALAAITLHRHLLQGTTYRTELFHDKNVDAVIMDVAEKLGVVGVCNFQFRLVDGEPVIFEINPRFSGTGGIRFLYGFNESEMMFDLFRLGIKISQPQLHDAVVLRYWNEIVIPCATFDSVGAGKTEHSGAEQTTREVKQD